MTEIVHFTESTLALAEQVVRSCFSEATVRLLRKMLENPLRQTCPEAGEIAVEDGSPRTFHAAVLRRGYIGQEPFLAVIGSTLGSLKDASPVSLYNVMKRTVASRGGSVFFISNTAVKSSVRMYAMVGVKDHAPDSRCVLRYGIVSWFAFIGYAIRKVFKGKGADASRVDGLANPDVIFQCERNGLKMTRKTVVDSKEFDVFWERYLTQNKGVTFSRSSEELAWLFADRLKSGKSILIAAHRDCRLVGYVFVKQVIPGVLWGVDDLIAEDDAADILKCLLFAAKRCLRKCTTAVFLQVFGFPERIHEVLRSECPLTRRLPNNPTVFNIQDKARQQEFLEKLPVGWFWGPYDGDYCMCE